MIDHDKEAKCLELERATLQGDEKSRSSAFFSLARMYSRGELGEPDKQKAREYYEKACALNHAGAMHNLALMYSRGELGEPDKQKAREYYEKACALNHAGAMHNLALMYSRGELGEPDKQKAREYYEKACALNYAGAMNNLALMYLRGELGEPDKEKAREYYEKACALNDAGAMNNLALMYDNGELGEPDKQKAREYYEKACALNHAGAMCNLALMYDNGELGEPDKQKAREYYEKACALNYAGAMNNLAIMYEYGGLGEPDMQKAREYYEKACALNQSDAMYNLAIMYKNGRLGKPNKQKARMYFEKAGEQGDADAWFNLAKMYFNGELGKLKKKEAQACFTKASSLGHVNAKDFLPNPLVESTRKKFLSAKVDEKLCQSISEALIALEDVFFELRQKHMLKGKNIKLSHFTAWSALESILNVNKADKQRNVLRQYHVDYMNDPTEGLRLLSFSDNKENTPPRWAAAKKVSSYLKEIFLKSYHDKIEQCPDSADVLPSVFITSLTKDDDRLDLWRAYGRDGDGYCLSFEVESDRRWTRNRDNHQAFLEPITKQEENGYESEKNKAFVKVESQCPPLYEIRYADEEVADALQKLEKPLRRIKNLTKKLKNTVLEEDVNSCVAAILLELLYLYKDEQYSNEHEVRALKVLRIKESEVECDERQPGRLYVETPAFLFTTPSRIIVGPKVNEKKAAVWNLRWRLNKLGYADKTSVIESKVQYR